MPLEPHPTDPTLMVYKSRQYDLPKPCEDDDDIQDYKKPWVGLTADELNMIGDSMRTWNSHSLTDVYVAIEAKLRSKNT